MARIWIGGRLPCQLNRVVVLAIVVGWGHLGAGERRKAGEAKKKVEKEVYNQMYNDFVVGSTHTIANRLENMYR